MTNKKMLSLSLLTLAFCSMAVATEYKGPEVGFKERAAPSKEMKTADFGDHFKVEDGRSNDRQIASEDESSERDPSSVEAKKKKDFVPSASEEPVEAPKPWLYRNEMKNSK
ncbi:MAG: hypothetical protein H7336_16885 [Bacteriovorax sp.]|nr:hypothetical protein [Bacteriovorax sp.]